MTTASGAISPARGRRRRKPPPLLRRTSMFRATFFVVANLVGFVAVNAFLHYLGTGQWLDLTPESYRAALAAPLGEMLLRPVSVFDQPWMIVVGGLLVAAVAFVPIMVAVLYRLRVSALFVLAVALIGHAPLLAAFLAAGCILAGNTRLRRNLPFLAVLTGLCPVVVYLYFFSVGGEQVLLPLQRLPVLATFILAMAAAVLAGAAVLALARLTRFRPGVIWPVLLIFLAAPVLLFYEKVGPAELDYALIAGRIGPGEAVLAADQDAPPGADGAAFPMPTTSPLRVRPAAPLAPARMDLERRRAALLGRCAGFIQRHPDSDRAAAVMWIMAVAKDVRIDKRALEAGFVRYVWAGPSTESKSAWADLAERHPRSPQAYVAHQRLGIQAIREGRAWKAREHLRTAQSLLMTYLGAAGADASHDKAGVFAPTESLPGLEYYRKVLADADRIIWLMETNKVLDAGAKNAEAFRDYMRLWPFTSAKGKELEDLAKGYQDTRLADNFRLQAAMTGSEGLDRALNLSRLAGDINDAAVAANYELGRLALRLENTPVWSDMELKTAEHYFKIVRSAQDNPYRAAAERHLARLAGREKP